MTTATKSPKSETLLEESFCEGVTVDREAGVIKGVKLIGLESKNGRGYTPKALREGISLYEGAKVNVNHPKDGPRSPRDYRDRLGVIKGVSFRENDGLYGDFHYNPKHSLAEQLAWDAEHNPRNVGFSHNAEGQISRKGGKTLVESLTRVISVDLVADPATTAGLFEHESAEVTLAEFIAANQFGDDASLVEMIAAQPMAATAKAPEGDQSNPLQAVLLTTINESLKTADVAVLKKVLKALGIEDSMSANIAPGKETTPADEPAKIAESVQEAVKLAVDAAIKPLMEENVAISKELAARKVLEAKGAAINPQLLEELTKCADKAAMEALVEGWSPAKLGKPKPQIAGFQEHAGAYPEAKNPFTGK